MGANNDDAIIFSRSAVNSDDLERSREQRK